MKHQGGRGGQKGVRYEDYYAVFLMAELVRDYLETKRDIKLEGQALAFVDDIVLIYPEQKRKYYQVKNSINISWGDVEKRSISSEFLKQSKLDRARNIESTITLVVSN